MHATLVIKEEEINMKISLIFFIIIFFSYGCKKGAQILTEPINNGTIEATIEGKLFYFVGGGTVEMPYPEVIN